jgi:hypothetical protein
MKNEWFEIKKKSFKCTVNIQMRLKNFEKKFAGFFVKWQQSQ